MSAKQALIEARKLIEAPERWTQRRYARSASGNGIDYNSAEAVCWCSAGALARVCPHDQVYLDAHLLLATSMAGNVMAFNDHHTHAEVLAAFDAAISKAEAGSLSAAIEASILLEQDGGHL